MAPAPCGAALEGSLPLVSDFGCLAGSQSERRVPGRRPRLPEIEFGQEGGALSFSLFQLHAGRAFKSLHSGVEPRDDTEPRLCSPPYPPLWNRTFLGLLCSGHGHLLLGRPADWKPWAFSCQLHRTLLPYIPSCQLFLGLSFPYPFGISPQISYISAAPFSPRTGVESHSFFPLSSCGPAPCQAHMAWTCQMFLPVVC